MQSSTDDLNELIKSVEASGYMSLGYTARAIGQWKNDISNYRKSLEGHARNSMVDLRDYLRGLPKAEGFESAEEYVLGYVPAADAYSQTDRDALTKWNDFQSRAYQLGDIPDFPDGDKIRPPLADLILEVAEFVALRKRLAKYAREAREYRSKLKG